MCSVVAINKSPIAQIKADGFLTCAPALLSLEIQAPVSVFSCWGSFLQCIDAVVDITPTNA